MSEAVKHPMVPKLYQEFVGRSGLTMAQNPDVRGNLKWTVERAGTGHGSVLWFDADLVEGWLLQCARGSRDSLRISFFPLEPICATRAESNRVHGR